MNKCVVQPISLIMLLVFGLLAVAAHAQSGTLSYPAVDNLDLQEGTIECWVRSDVEVPTAAADQMRVLVSLFRFSGRDGGLSVYSMLSAKSTTPVWWCSIGPKPQFTAIGMGDAPSKQGEWHHVALTWKGQDMRAYINGTFVGERKGKIIGERKQSVSLQKGFGDLDAAKPIVLGGIYGATGRCVIDEFRLSRVVRKREELGFHGPLKADAVTAILDTFEEEFTPDGKAATHPAKILGGGGGTPSVNCKFGEGRFGKGLFLYTPEGRP